MTPLTRFICATLIFLWCAAAPPKSSAGTGVTGLKPVELPDGEGKDDVEAYCGACHSLRIVLQQRLSRSNWDDVLITMVEEHGMSEIPSDDRALILDYLAEHLGPDKPPNTPPLQ